MLATWVWVENDNDLRIVLAKEQPQVIVSVGPNQTETTFPNLWKLPLDERQRWIAFDTFDKITDTALRSCMMNYIRSLSNNNEKVLISVFTPSFKSKHRIQRPFNSLLSQTYTYWEWIIVNDCDDECDGGENWKTLCDLAARDNRIKVFQPSRHSGVIGHLKRDAAYLGKGQLLVELDHDDDIHPQTFEWLIQAYHEHPNAGMFWTDFAEVFEPDQKAYDLSIEGEDVDDNFKYGENFSFGYGAYTKQFYLGKWRNMVHTSPINSKTMRYIVGVPNHLRVWTAKAYREMGGHSPLLHVVDDYELIVRTFLKYPMVRIPKLCYIQYRNVGGNNFTFIRNQEIQKLTRWTAQIYEQDITNRIKELGLPEFGDENLLKHWLYTDDRKYDARADQLALVPKDLVSILVAFPTDGPMAISDQTIQKGIESLVNQPNVEVIVIGVKNSRIERVMRHFKNENLRWWNLEDDGSFPMHMWWCVALNYALKMVSVGPIVTYANVEEPWKRDEAKERLSALHANMKGDVSLSFHHGKKIHHMCHTRNLIQKLQLPYWETSKTKKIWKVAFEHYKHE